VDRSESKRCILAACLLFSSLAVADGPYPVVGEVERFSPAMDRLVPAGAVVERLTEDRFSWSEGPVWVPQGGYLLFSDVPENKMWKWSEEGGLQPFLDPSALADGRPVDPSGQGTNGLVLTLGGRLLAADHGSRSLYELDLDSKERRPVSTGYRDRRYNSPNDLVVSRLRWPGAVFFTDPPYGLDGQDRSGMKELDFNGVFRLDPSGEVTMLDDTLSRPNGIGLSPDEKTLYVAVSNRSNLVIRAYNLDDDGSVVGEPGTLATTTRWHQAGDRGSNDGLAVDTEGNLWATGPGGVFVIDPNGEILGRIRTGTPAANCTFGGPDGRTLYITSAAFLARIRTNARGLGLP
jgi:gluconolactonase